VNAQTQLVERAAEVAPQEQQRPKLPAIIAGGSVKAIVPQDFDSAWRIARVITAAGMAPQGFDTAEKAMVAIMHGLELGLTPMNAMQSVAVINNKPTIYGDAAIGLVRASGLLEWIKETVEGEGDAMTARCVVKRKGEAEPIVGEFSVADAKIAKLWGKAGPWTNYWKRMLKVRARAFALRDGFADVLKGMHIKEEVEDYSNGNGKTVEHDDGPPAPPPEPIKTASPPISSPEPDPIDADFVETPMPDDGPPDPNATASAKLDAKIPVDTEAFLAWVKEAFANCDADMLPDTYAESIEPHVPVELQEDVMALYRARERELEDAPPEPKAEPTLDEQMLAEIAAHTNPIDLTRWGVSNFAVREGLPQETKTRVEAAFARKLKDLKAAQTK
jgi:hypothetical protein